MRVNPLKDLVEVIYLEFVRRGEIITPLRILDEVTKRYHEDKPELSRQAVTYYLKQAKARHGDIGNHSSEEAIRDYLKRHPAATDEVIAKELGLSVKTVKRRR